MRSALSAIIVLAMSAMLGACSGTTPTPPRMSAEASAEIVKKDCSDPKWKDENLGLWYSVCRQPMKW